MCFSICADSMRLSIRDRKTGTMLPWDFESMHCQIQFSTMPCNAMRTDQVTYPISLS